jgi:uroporphyrinogen-III decarboxylase
MAMSSRERLISALTHQNPDHTPCAFMLYGALHKSSRDYLEFIDRQLEMGLDTFVELPPRAPLTVNDHYNLHGLPVSFHPAVSVREFNLPGGSEPVLVKEYHTPAGTLTCEVKQTDDWRWGDHVPFLDDYIIPRAVKFPLSGEQDLAAIQYLLQAPTHDEILAARQDCQPILEKARKEDLLVAGGWGVGADLVGWVYGLTPMIMDVYDHPDFLKALLGMIADWNHTRMSVLLEMGLDLYIKRAWYENCDFFSPKKWQEFILPILKQDADLAHQAKLGYIITARAMPLLDMIAEAGVDVIIGVDPHTFDLEKAYQKLTGRVCLWGGVNGHLTVEQGTPEQVQEEVQHAIETLAPGGGFILSPVDNMREDTPRLRENVSALIKAWQDTF